MSSTRVLALLAATAFAGAAPQAVAQTNQQAPRGSYTQTCRNIDYGSTGYLSAECNADQGRVRWSTIYAPYCTSDISNRDGMLSCQGSTATGGQYVDRPSTADRPSTTESIIGSVLGQIFGIEPQSQTQTQGELYGPGARYPAYGEQGYGDPRYDPRFGPNGWGSGQPRGAFVPISSRRNWLEQRISASERQGLISRTDATRLRTDLTALVRLETTYAGGGLTNAERADLDRRFDALALSASVGGGAGWTGLSERQAEINSRIDAGIRSRDLTSAQASALRREFSDIMALEAQYQRNGLTAPEQAELQRRFDAFEARLPELRGPGRGGGGEGRSIAEREEQIERRIDRALADRRITTRQAASFRTEFDDLVRLEQRYEQNGLTNTERQDLQSRLVDLRQRIGGPDDDDDASPGGRWIPISERQYQVYTGIDAALRDRRITVQQATTLRSRFQELVRIEASYQSGGLTRQEQDDLERRFQAYEDSLPGGSGNGGIVPWVRLMDRQSTFGPAVDRALFERRISSSQAVDIRQQFQRLIQLEADYNAGGLSAAERNDLESRYEALLGRLR